ncbi:MAG: TMEM165/GDT1 family protein [Acidobacteria bacterium]|nr:TMEM165/GDT1 family protein [Acidobacteriota bacterium]
MNWRIMLATFSTLFLAELGDKTQLAVITLTANTRQPIPVFAGAVTALAVVTGLGVLFGGAALQLVPEAVIRKVAAGAFIVIGVLMFFGKV